jgi:transcriptional regulator with XRE-family HTH domain
MATHNENLPRMPANKAIANRIRELCNARNISINSLAAEARVPASTLYSLLNGKSQNPEIVNIERLCRTLCVELYTFFDSSLFGQMDDI